MKHLEDELQKRIMNWWRIQKPPFFLFSIENGGKRNRFEAYRLKKKGVTSGVSDMCAMMPDGKVKWIELKKPATYKVGQSGKRVIATPKGVQSDNQKFFQEECERLGHDYYVVYSLEEFMDIFKNPTV